MSNKPNINKFPFIQNNPIQLYERYLPSAFDESLSILQKINKVIHQMNQVGEISNEVIRQWNLIMEWIVGNGLSDAVSEEMDKRIEDGTFDTLIYKIVGDLTELTTEDKTNLVNAINEIGEIVLKNSNDIGDIEKLTTNNKTSLVVAINELKKQSDIDSQATITIGESTGHGVISGMKVTEQTVLAMAVRVGNDSTPNIVHLPNGVRYELESTNISINNSDSLLNRKDIVFVNENGTVSYLAGTLAQTPTEPTLPNNSVLLATINVTANDTTINNIDIIDKRNMKSLNDLLTDNKSNFVQAVNEIYNRFLDHVEAQNLVNSQLDEKIDGVNDSLITKINETATSLSNDIDGVNETINNRIDIVDNEITQQINNIEQNLQTSNKKLVVSETHPTEQNVNDLWVNIINKTINRKTDSGYEVIHVQTTTKQVIDLLAGKTLEDVLTGINNTIGNLPDLDTDDKTSVVNAINEIVNSTETSGKIGELTDLLTADQTNIVASINELYTDYENNMQTLDLNVKMFGAVGDGITDDTVSIQTAIDFALEKKAKLRVPYGEYLITESLLINDAGFIILEGDGGTERTTIFKTNNNIDIIKVTSNYHIAVKDIMFDHNGNSGSGINFVSGESHQLIDCVFINKLGNRSDMTQFYASNYRVLNCRFNNHEPLAYAVHVGKNVGLISINSFVNSNYFAGEGKGVLIDSNDLLERVEGLKIRDNVFINTGAEQITIRTILDLDVSNNMIDQCSNSAIFVDPEGTLVDTVRITDNYISPAKDAVNGIGVHFRNIEKNVKNVIISNNRFNLGGYGIVAYKNTEDVLISDNYFALFSQSAININGTKTVSVLDNMFSNNNFDLSLTDGTTGSSYLVANNSFKDKVALTMTNKDNFTVHNNIGYINKSIRSGKADASVAQNVYLNIPHGLAGIPDLKKSFVSVNVANTSVEIGGCWIITADSSNVTVAVNIKLEQPSAMVDVNIVCEL